MEPFATVQDAVGLWRPMTADEQERAENLLPVISDTLRYEAEKVGKDLDKMIEAQVYLTNVVKSVTVDVLARTLMTSTDAEPMTQNRRWDILILERILSQAADCLLKKQSWPG